MAIVRRVPSNSVLDEQQSWACHKTDNRMLQGSESQIKQRKELAQITCDVMVTSLLTYSYLLQPKVCNRCSALHCDEPATFHCGQWSVQRSTRSLSVCLSHPGCATLAHGVTIQKSSPTTSNAAAQSVAAASWRGERHTGEVEGELDRGEEGGRVLRKEDASRCTLKTASQKPFRIATSAPQGPSDEA